MRFDIVLAGVGGQGVLSLSAIIALSALDERLYAKQSEVHGMAQRGGAVVTNLRLSDSRIASGLIPKATASMILSLEPLESLRYLDYLSPGGCLITSSDPVINIPNYPAMSKLFEKIVSFPNAVLVDGGRLAKTAGAPRASNMVIAGAASHVLPVDVPTMEHHIELMFKRKGNRVVDSNINAFRAGREAYLEETARPKVI
jgi:indolepyruvate ferredoxin oxidoreductase beta subunit